MDTAQTAMKKPNTGQAAKHETAATPAIKAVTDAIEAYRAETSDLGAHLTEVARQVYLVLHEADALDKNARFPEVEQWAKLPWAWRIDYIQFVDGPRYTLRHADGGMLYWDASGGGHVILDRLDEDLAAGWWDVLVEYGAASKTKRRIMLKQVRPADLEEDTSGQGMGMSDDQKQAIHEAEARLAEVKSILDAVLGLSTTLESDLGAKRRDHAEVDDDLDETDQVTRLLEHASAIRDECRGFADRASLKVQEALDAAHDDMSPDEKEHYREKYGTEMSVATDD